MLLAMAAAFAGRHDAATTESVWLYNIRQKMQVAFARLNRLLSLDSHKMYARVC